MTYKVSVRTSLTQFSRRQWEVIRRFSDFSYLHQRLCDRFKGVIVPPLPEKNAMQKIQIKDEFVETRRKALSVFINRVAQHPILGPSDDFRRFLEAAEDEWAR